MEPIQCVSVREIIYTIKTSFHLHLRCTTTETQYKAAAQSLISLGLSTLGYNYVNLCDFNQIILVNTLLTIQKRLWLAGKSAKL